MAYSGVYGRGLTASQVAQSLRELDNMGQSNYWDETANQYAEQYKSGLNILKSSYDEAIEQAYASNRQQQRQLSMTDIVGAGRSELGAELRGAYESAYESYTNSLYEGQQNLIGTYYEQLTNLSSQLQERAENYAKFGNMSYDYLQYLYNTYYTGDTSSDFWNNEVFKSMFIKQTTNPGDDPNAMPVLDAAGEQVTDEDGNPLYYTLKSRGELFNASLDEGGEYTSIYDENGYLTEFGRTYFDLIENYNYGNDVSTFGDWLYETDQDLWTYMYETPNVYDESTSGYNIETWHELTGRSASDYDFSVADNLSGIPKSFLENSFKSYSSKLDEALNIGNTEDRLQAVIDTAPTLASNLEKVAKEMGVYDDEMASQIEQFKETISKISDEYKDKGELTTDFFQGLITSEGVLGGAVGALGSNPATAPFAVLIASIGFIGNAIKSGIDVYNSQQNNALLANNLRDAYVKSVNSMAEIAYRKRETNN